MYPNNISKNITDSMYYRYYLNEKIKQQHENYLNKTKKKDTTTKSLTQNNKNPSN